MIVLLSPAKRLNEHTEISSQQISVPSFLEGSKSIMKRLADKRPKQLQQLQAISSALAEENYQRNQVWLQKEGEGEIPAVYLFDGEVYRGLAAPAWKEATKLYAQDHLRILSGLYGWLRPFDHVLPYRLEMGTALSIGRKKNLYDFWQEKLRSALTDLAKERPVLNLASAEYFRAVDPSFFKAQIHQVDFLEDKGDGGAPRPIQVFMKQARGMLANYVLENQIERVEDLAGFMEKGYQFDPSRSSSSKTVFLRHH